VKRELSSQPELALSAVILAGGASSRMGRDKAWVESAGKPLIQLAVEKVRELGIQEIFISGRADGDYRALHLPVLFDLEPGFGPLGGIERGLRHCSQPLLLVLAVDLPHMSVAFLRKLVTQCDRLTGAVPRLRGELDPLAAVYPKRCHAFAFSAITKAQLAAHDFVTACVREHAVRLFSVSPADTPCFVNCNTPADVAACTSAMPKR